MKLLVITPTLGESTWLAEAVASVAACAPDAAHVLVAPERAVAALARQFPGVNVLAERGGGMYAAINRALRGVAAWDAFSYLNDDDLLLPEFSVILGAAAARVSESEAAIVYGGVRLIDAAGRRLGAIPISPAPSLNRALYAERLEPVYQHGTVVPRRVVETIGDFDEALRLCGDSEFLARACVRGVGFLCATRGEVAAFRLRAGQLTKNRAAMLAEREAVDAKLGLRDLPGWARRRWARLVFRAANSRVYAERIARHGFVRFDGLLARSGDER